MRLEFTNISFSLNDIGIDIHQLNGEEWKYIPDTDERYAISNKGRILSIKWMNGKAPKIMNPGTDNKGYLRVGIPFISLNATKSVRIHRLVAMAFIQNMNNKEVINHKDFNKINNNVDNLEWVTSRENTMHSYHAGRMTALNSSKGNAKLSDFKAEIIREQRKKGLAVFQLAKMFNVSNSAIKHILKGATWNHVK